MKPLLLHPHKGTVLYDDIPRFAMVWRSIHTTGQTNPLFVSLSTYKKTLPKLLKSIAAMGITFRSKNSRRKKTPLKLNFFST